MPIFYTDTGSFNILQVTGSTTLSSSAHPLTVIGSGSAIVSITGSGGGILEISDVGNNTDLLTVASGSIDVFKVTTGREVQVTGSITVNSGSVISSLISPILTTVNSITASIFDSTIITLNSTIITCSLPSITPSINGKQYYIKNEGTATVLIDPSGSQTIDNSLTRTLAPYEDLIIQGYNNGNDWIILNRKPCVIPFAHDAQVTVADTTTYYFGNQIYGPPSTVSDVSRQQIALVSGWITDITLLVSVAGTTATSEDSTLILRNVTTSTNTTVTSTLEHNTANQLLQFSLATPLRVTKGDRLEFRWTTPNWGTNPGTVRHIAQALIQ